MNPHDQTEVQALQTAAYKEALLDVYLYLTGDERITQYPERMPLIEHMIAEVNKKNNRLTLIA